ncbi:MAG: family 65 glycosyl hydrolase domain-containing protein [Bacteroidota bacterium]|nr:family 65 glycosyl hydrolase domain-containing protein [Bacteroidota bacterium]
MNKYLKNNEWNIVEEGFDPKNHKASESIFSLGNGHMGQRANFEERYTGKSLQGNYVAGIYYPDKTRVGWWKNGYPEYFAKVLNSPNWIGIDVQINHDYLDLAKCKTENFRRVLNMKEGYLQRSFVAVMANGNKVKVEVIRFLNMAQPETGAIKYSITPLNFNGEISFTPFIDGDVKNEDANYNEKFWNILETETIDFEGYLLSQTKKLDFSVGFGMKCQVEINGEPFTEAPTHIKGPKYVGNIIKLNAKEGDSVVLYKYGAVLSSLNHPASELLKLTKQKLVETAKTGFETLFEAHKNKWSEIWSHSDIQIQGDIEAQQGIRFNIFHLNQTYTGEDERLNIGPKGFTGEKYGGSTYWDTEAYCIPFFISTAPSKVTRNLLIYRYKHLQKAIENAQKLGFTNGAALYPMVTMNGEECHNEWEITFEEIHRNGAIAFAIFNYIRHTGDDNYLAEYGLEVLIGISRFWSQRVNYSEAKKQYVMLGVTGPNEYENNVNNNWYTSTIAKWCMEYTLQCIESIKKQNFTKYSEIVTKTKFNEATEPKKWKDICDKFYFPYDSDQKIFLQQEGYLDKEQVLTSQLDPAQRPINQHWSWDHILRSCFIKQADVLQGIYLFEENYDLETIKRHFDFYESRTVHESSLSPCVHSILAARIGDMPKAYKLYLRTSRLDIDDYNHEVHEGLHITSMAGTWMSIVEGFGGKRVLHGKLHLNPLIPEKWDEYSFKILFKGVDILVTVNKQQVNLTAKNHPATINIYGNDIDLKPDKTENIALRTKIES